MECEFSLVVILIHSMTHSNNGCWKAADAPERSRRPCLFMLTGDRRMHANSLAQQSSSTPPKLFAWHPISDGALPTTACMRGIPLPGACTRVTTADQICKKPTSAEQGVTLTDSSIAPALTPAMSKPGCASPRNGMWTPSATGAVALLTTAAAGECNSASR